MKTTHLIQLLVEHEKLNPGSSVHFDYYNYPVSLLGNDRGEVMSIVPQDGNLTLELADGNKILNLRRYLPDDPNRLDIFSESA